MHTPQQTLEISCFHLIKQDRPGYEQRPGFYGCRYAQGCAAAPLFKPGTDLEALDGLEDTVDNSEIAAHLDGHDRDFVRDLQIAHDEVASSILWSKDDWRQHWFREVQAVARRRSLDFTPILEAARAAGWEVPA